MASIKYLCGVMLFQLYLYACVEAEVESFGKSFIDDVTLSSKEKEILDLFSQRVRFRLRVPYMRHEFYLVRWLRAKHFNLDAAEQMLIDHLKWWDKNQMDTIDQENWADFESDYKIWIIESDKEGRPIIYLNIGIWDFRKASVTGNSDRLIRYCGMMLEKGTRLVRRLGEQNRNVSQGLFILNADEFNPVTHGCFQCLPIVFRIITLYEHHFPGYGNKIIILNVPTAALFIVDPARRVFHPDTNKILRVYGTKRQWQPVLERYIDSNIIPTELGGSNVLDGRDYDY